MVLRTETEVTRSRAYKKNDQAFVEQKNGAVVRRLVGYGRFDGIETARVMVRLYAAARLHVNFFQPSFKLKEKRREGAKVIKRYHAPATPYERALAHPKLSEAVKSWLRETYRGLDPVALLAEIRAAQQELGERIGNRGSATAAASPVDRSLSPDPSVARPKLAKTCDASRWKAILQERIRMPSKLDPHLARIEVWLAAEPQLTALAIVHRLAEMDAATFSDKQHSIMQRLLRSLRGKAARTVVAATTTQAMTYHDNQHGPMDVAACNEHSASPTGPSAEPASAPHQPDSSHPNRLAGVTFCRGNTRGPD